MLLSSERAFSVWRYGVAHPQFLMRFLPASAEQDCVDLRFEAVAAMKLAVYYKTIAVCSVSEDVTRELHTFARVEEKWQPKYVTGVYGILVEWQADEKHEVTGLPG